MLNLSDSLSILLDDGPFSGNLTRLFSQFTRLNDSTSFWNGKQSESESSDEHWPSVKVRFGRIKLAMISINRFRPRCLSILSICLIFINRGSWLNGKRPSRTWMSPWRSTPHPCVGMVPTYVDRQQFSSKDCSISILQAYRSASIIKLAFCGNRQLNRTFFLNQTQWVEARDILCVNLSSSDLKAFLISVQSQLDEIFLVRIATPPWLTIVFFVCVSRFRYNREYPVSPQKCLRSVNELHLIGSDQSVWTRRLVKRSIIFAVVRICWTCRSRSMEAMAASGSANCISVIARCLIPQPSISFSATSLCGGRNDLSNFFAQNSSNKSAKRARRAAPTTSGRASLNDINWNNLASYLMSYEPSEVCPQYYSTGSGNLMQFVLVNRTCRCAVFDQLFRSVDVLRPFSTLLRPLLYGKIYYHPSNLQYDGLIKEINRTFESLDELVKLLRQIETPLVAAQQTFEIICWGSLNRSTFCRQINAYQSSINLFLILTEFIACSERNRFVPMASEAAMVRAGQNNSVTNTFLAAIEFLDDITDNQTLPKHLRYKIRMALDYVDSTFRTEDR